MRFHVFVPCPSANPCYAGRVEERRGAARAVRFLSPLIERSMRISRTTLSDWFHREHAAGDSMSVFHVLIPALTSRHSLLGWLPVSNGA
jgi:hypothetical protein